jgi:hypothetical protein
MLYTLPGCAVITIAGQQGLAIGGDLPALKLCCWRWDCTALRFRRFNERRLQLVMWPTEGLSHGWAIFCTPTLLQPVSWHDSMKPTGMCCVLSESLYREGDPACLGQAVWSATTLHHVLMRWPSSNWRYRSRDMLRPYQRVSQGYAEGRALPC